MNKRNSATKFFSKDEYRQGERKRNKYDFNWEIYDHDLLKKKH